MAIHNLKTKRVTLEDFFAELTENDSYIESKFDKSIMPNKLSHFNVKPVQLLPIEQEISSSSTEMTIDSSDDVNARASVYENNVNPLNSSLTGTGDSMIYESVVFSNDNSFSGFDF
ncbi:hypothetical protein [Aliivibrio fischeri]|uniref:hypothetical protein n=1 Tax=Aliivibrio fischeri TaxID=668 RepID=UPI0012D8D1CA|nr:hypothetical protein [Aliivibrio fischeri]MUJ20375.1 hypothetical protein [Aliivibrio fischeri]